MKNYFVVLSHTLFLHHLSKSSLLSISRLRFILVFSLLLTVSSNVFAQTETDYKEVDKEDELKKICWPQVSTSKTEATTTKMKTDPPPSGGLATFRSLLNAVEIPNSFPLPTIEIYDLLGNPLIINGTQIQFSSSSVAAFKADSILGTTNGYHWIGYQSNPFQPDNQGIYFYNIFHRWFGGMPSNYHNFGGRQWNSDNSGHSNYADTVFVPHPISVSIIHPVTCYGTNDGILKANVNPLNYYTFSIDQQPPTLNSTFIGVSAGSHTITITDSFANHYDTIINLSQPPPLGSSISITNCGAFTWQTNSATYASSGTYLYVSNNNGCLQTDTLNLTITNSTSASSNITAYNFYTWPVNGQTYTATGTYFYNSLTAGCQTVSILHLTIINAPFNMNVVIDQPISCFGNNDGSCQANAFPFSFSYVYQLDGGVQTNASGFFQNISTGTHTICAFNGSNSVCKTITFVDPLPLLLSIVTDSIVSCLGNDGGLSAVISGGTTNAQNYLTYWTNSSNVLLNPLPYNFDTYITGITPGAYHLLVEDDNGCTRTASKAMNAAPPIVVTATAAPIKCYGGTTPIVPSSTGGIAPITYTIFGLPLFSGYPAGTYEITATDAKGCTATTIIDFGQPAQLSSSSTAVACSSYYWSINGATYTTSGTYISMLTTIAGCQIMNVLHLTINTNTTSTQNVTACNSYLWPLNNLTYTNSGIYTTTSFNAAGCLLTTTLNLTINYSNTSNINATACNSYSWTATGAINPYTTSGIYTATSLNNSGCLHTDTLHLTVNYSNNASQTVIACNTYMWPVSGATYTTSGNYTKTSLNIAGCVHTDTLHLTINYSSSSISNVTANNSFTWLANNVTYTVSGVYSTTLVNAVGCDSILTLNLTINPVPSVLNLRCFIEAYMEDVNLMRPVLANQTQATTGNACDTIKVELHNVIPPYNTLYSTKVVVNTSGFATCIFPPLSGNYFIAIKHRSAIQTWSANPIFIGATPVLYNFTNAASKAYGANQIQVSSGVWAFYSGDVNQDENIDLNDIGLVEPDITGFNYGFLPTDVNGDGGVDLLDLPYIENNLTDFIYSVHP